MIVFNKKIRKKIKKYVLRDVHKNKKIYEDFADQDVNERLRIIIKRIGRKESLKLELSNFEIINNSILSDYSLNIKNKKHEISFVVKNFFRGYLAEINNYLFEIKSKYRIFWSKGKYYYKNKIVLDGEVPNCSAFKLISFKEWILDEIQDILLENQINLIKEKYEKRNRKV